MMKPAFAGRASTNLGVATPGRNFSGPNLPDFPRSGKLFRKSDSLGASRKKAGFR